MYTKLNSMKESLTCQHALGTTLVHTSVCIRTTGILFHSKRRFKKEPLVGITCIVWCGYKVFKILRYLHRMPIHGLQDNGRF